MKIAVKLKSIWKKENLPYALALMPIIFLASFMILKTVNVPYWDHWEFVPLIQHVRDGNLYFTDFWHQHNEHRLLFPRIIMIIAALITGWNVQVENLIGFVFACCSFVVLMKTLGSTQKQLKQTSLFVMPLLLSLIWFSPVQEENWLWGWQIQWFLNVFVIMVIVREIARIKNNDLSYPKTLLIAACAVVAQYSLGNGVLIWPLLVAALLFLRVPLQKTALVAVTAVASTGLYYLDYVSPPVTPGLSKTLFLQQPVTFVKYVATYIGRPLAYVPRLAPALGLLLICIFFSLTLYLFVKKREMFKAQVPWIVLGLYSLGSAVVTGASRLGLGLGQAYTSRYITISSLFLISTIVMCVESRSVFEAWLGKRSLKNISMLILVCLFALLLTNAAYGVHAALKRSNNLQQEKSCTQLPNPTQECLLSAYPYPEIGLERLNYLKQIHWGGY